MRDRLHALSPLLLCLSVALTGCPDDGGGGGGNETPTPNVTPDASATPMSTPQMSPDATPMSTPDATPQMTPMSTPMSTPDATPPVSATPMATPDCPDTMNCNGRDCGPDPVCGISCGDCANNGRCTPIGLCEPCVSTGPERNWESCRDGADNDCDGLTDSDPECNICPPPGDLARRVENSDELCTDGLDNDCNGFADCGDNSCRNVAACPVEKDDISCSDGQDNDLDRRLDCAQRSCTDPMGNVTVCFPPEEQRVAQGMEATVPLCSNRLDDDANGFTDCDDNSCAGLGACVADGEPESTVSCDDDFDNDGDGRVDCADGDCAEAENCLREQTDAACGDSIDNDGDGRVDCGDSDCYRNPAISGCYSGVELDNTGCTDGMDNDSDGLTDCQDPSCAETCSVQPCAETNPQGSCDNPRHVCAGAAGCAIPLEGFQVPNEATVLITEIMANPTTVLDNAGEWFEVLNVSGQRINLQGLMVRDGSSSPVEVTQPVILEPDARHLFLANGNAQENGGLTGTQVRLSLSNSNPDSVELSFDGAVIHAVAWDSDRNDLRNIPFGPNASRSLNLNQAFIDDPVSAPAIWCHTPQSEELGYFNEPPFTDYGTPGAPNVVCQEAGAP